MTRTHYEHLGVSPDATLQDIKRAYRRAARRLHPDTGATPDPDRFDAISRAFGVLRDPVQRASYDRDPGDRDATHIEVDRDVDAEDWDAPEPDIDKEGEGLPEPTIGVRSPGRDLRWIATATALGLIGCVLLLVVAGTVASGLGPLILGCVLGAWFCVRVPVRSLPPCRRAAAAVVVAVSMFVLGPVASLLQGLVLGWGALGPGVLSWREQRRLDEIIMPATLRDHEVFGEMPPGVAASLLDQVCQAVRPAAGRILRCSDPEGPFSHAVVCGQRVALVAASLEAPGDYSWSGPSLLAMPAGDEWPCEVLRSDFAGAQSRVQELAGPSARVESWMVLICPDGGEVRGRSYEGMPSVVDPDRAGREIARFLTGDVESETKLVVDQRLVCQVAQVFH